MKICYNEDEEENQAGMDSIFRRILNKEYLEVNVKVLYEDGKGDFIKGGLR